MMKANAAYIKFTSPVLKFIKNRIAIVKLTIDKLKFPASVGFFLPNLDKIKVDKIVAAS